MRAVHKASPQVSIAQLQKSIFQYNQRRIQALTKSPSITFQRYGQEYKAAVRNWVGITSKKHIAQAIQHASIIYVGDDHALSQSQMFFEELISNAIPKITVALECLESKHQKSIDLFLQRKISINTLKTIVYPSQRTWCGHWKTIASILRTAQKRDFNILAIDSAGRGPGEALRNRDKHAARIITQYHQKHPKQPIYVLIGQWHVAPKHLPAEVKRTAHHALRDVIIYQNCDNIYHAIATPNATENTRWIKVKNNTYCALHTPPIVCQQALLHWLEHDTEETWLESPETQVKSYARAIAKFFNLPHNTAIEHLEVHTFRDLRFIQLLKSRGQFSARDMHIIKKQIKTSES